MKLALLQVAHLAIAACGSAAGATSRPAGRWLDRADVVATAEALVTSALDLDFATVTALVIPEDQHALEDMKAAQKLSRILPVEEVNVTARLVEKSGITATIDYRRSYCVAGQAHEATVTASGQAKESASSDGDSVKEPSRCLYLADMFQPHRIQDRRIDGTWYGPLPT